MTYYIVKTNVDPINPSHHKFNDIDSAKRFATVISASNTQKIETKIYKVEIIETPID